MPQAVKIRWMSVLMLIGIVELTVVLVIGVKVLDVQSLVQHALDWVQGLGAWGAIAFMLLYSLATVLFIPGSLLTLGAGVLFGVPVGSLAVFVGASVGATLAFLVGRYLARGWVAKRIADNETFRALDQAIAREGFKLVLLTRLSPVFPFNVLNYSLGLTQVSLKDYVLGCVGMIPATIAYVYLGSLAGSLALIGSASTANPQAQGLQWGIRIVGLIATLIVTGVITRLARQALNQSISQEN